MLLPLYYIGLQLYKFAAVIISPFNTKAKRWLRGQRKLAKSIEEAFAKVGDNEKVMWMHCSSLGEFEQGRPVIEAFREKHPSYKILLTFFSPSGYEIRKDYDKVDWVFYLPLDTYRNAKRFVRAVNPSIAIFVKYEFWYHYLNNLKNRGVKTYLISSIFRPKQSFFKKYGGFSRKMLRCFSHLFVQNAESIELLKSIGITNVTLAGDTRFDRVQQLVSQAIDIPIIEKFKSGKPLLIAGSTWTNEEDKLAEYIDKHNDMQMVIAPHEVNESHINFLVKLFSAKKVARYTQAEGIENLSEYDVLIMDTVGLLMSAYRYGDWSYIGGGFIKSGVHNTLEPATFGLPVVFGPIYENFMEAVELLKAEGGLCFTTQDELDTIFDLLRTNKDFRVKAGKKSKDFVEQNLGATQTIINNLIA